LVFAGLATTKILQHSLATFYKASPYTLKIFPFIFNKSFLSIPSFLGNPPMKTPTSKSLKASSALDDGRTLSNKG